MNAGESGVPGRSEREEARDFLLSRLREADHSPPRLAVVLGSGLGEAAPELEDIEEVSFEEIPGWPDSGVAGHEGTLLFGGWRGREVMVQQGRLHFYEGLDMEAVTLPVRLMHGLGVQKVLMSNAAGALNPLYMKGHLMLVRDHINMMGVNPLRGIRDPRGQPAFLDVSSLYDEGAGDSLMERSRVSGWPMQEGTLVAVSGPTYETAAELRFMRLIGGDAVSMSLVPEALVAYFLGLSVTAASVITNVWDLRRPQPISHEEVLETAARASTVLREVIAAWLEEPDGVSP